MIRISRAQDQREGEKNRISIIEFFKINGNNEDENIKRVY